MRSFEQCSARKTYPKFNLDMLRHDGKYPAIPIRDSGDGDIVDPRVGRLDSSAELHQARELFLDQKTKDVVHMACVITPPPTFLQPLPK